MVEIGGYLGLEEFHGKQYHEGLLRLNNARSCLHYIIKAKKYTNIYLPYYLCGSVSQKLDVIGVKYSYYHVDREFCPELDVNISDDQCVYIVNYYGQLTNERIVEFKKKYRNLIIDNVQAYFQRPVEGVDTLYSCRKYIGVPDGGYLATEKRIDDIFEPDLSAGRMDHLLGRLEESANKYYDAFKKNDESFDDSCIRRMSKITDSLLNAVDYDYVINKRNQNFQYLHSKLRDTNHLAIKCPIGPFAYPYFVDNADEIRAKLIRHKTYVARLWPDINEGANRLEKEFVNNILPLPVDQRYGIEEMKRIVDTIMM